MLLSVFYAVYHGPQRLEAIAEEVVALNRILEQGINHLGYETRSRGRAVQGRSACDSITDGLGLRLGLTAR